MVGLGVFERLKVEHHAEQSYSVEGNALLRQIAGNAGGPGGAVAYSQQEERRSPALVTRDVLTNEFAGSCDVTLLSPEFLGDLRSFAATEAGANRVQQHQVTLVEQGVRIIPDLVGSWGQKAVGRKRHSPRTERAHVQPD